MLHSMWASFPILVIFTTPMFHKRRESTSPWWQTHFTIANFWCLSFGCHGSLFKFNTDPASQYLLSAEKFILIKLSSPFYNKGLTVLLLNVGLILLICLCLFVCWLPCNNGMCFRALLIVSHIVIQISIIRMMLNWWVRMSMH